jgi:hypothetical protein
MAYHLVISCNATVIDLDEVELVVVGGFLDSLACKQVRRSIKNSATQDYHQNEGREQEYRANPRLRPIPPHKRGQHAHPAHHHQHRAVLPSTLMQPIHIHLSTFKATALLLHLLLSTQSDRHQVAIHPRPTQNLLSRALPHFPATLGCR